MAWENRRNGRYYYSKRKVKGKVVSEYAGTGYAAHLAEQLSKAVRREADQKRQEWEAVKDEQQRLDKIVDDFAELTRGYIDAILLVSGHRLHKRQWRKKRERNRKSTG
jgi:hypothetical protein